MLDKFILAGLVASVGAHMKMSNPAPFDNQRLSNGPLSASGSDFPCKNADYSVLPAQSNIYAQGSVQTLKFIGSAVHGGGSCQVSLTTDPKPSKNSVWKVIQSIEGGCPAKDQTGNLQGSSANTPSPYTYDFTIPKELATGNYTLAWTWFNKIGNREMYMNCAPIGVTGSGGSQSYLDSLPDMFEANINNGCGTESATDLKFPDPGQNLDQFGLKTSSALAPPTGNCKTGGGSRPTRVNTSSGPEPTSSKLKPTSPSNPKPTSGSSRPTSIGSRPTSGSSRPTSIGSRPTSGSSRPTSIGSRPTSGSSWLTSIGSRPASDSSRPTSIGSKPTRSSRPEPPTGTGSRPRPTSTKTACSSRKPSGPQLTTPIGGPTAPVSQKQTTIPAHSPTRDTESAPAPTPGTGGAFTVGTPCTSEGMWNCVGGTSFQRCSNGMWHETQAVTAGTACVPGQGDELKMSPAGPNQCNLRRGRRMSV